MHPIDSPTPLSDAGRLLAEIARHPKSALIEALADAMHSIEDDDGGGRHMSYYRSLAYATVEMLPALFYDEDATCDEPGCGAHPARSHSAGDLPEGQQSKESEGSARVFVKIGDEWRLSTADSVEQLASVFAAEVARVRAAERERVARYLERGAEQKRANARDTVAPHFGDIEAMALIEAAGWCRDATVWPAEPSVGAPTPDVGTPDHRCPSRISHRGAVIRCFYYRGHDTSAVLHEAAGTAWRDDDDRELPADPILPETQEGREP